MSVMSMQGFSDDDVQRMVDESGGKLDPRQVLILLVLRGLPPHESIERKELKHECGIRGDYSPTWLQSLKDLKELGLIEIDDRKRPYAHRVTEPGRQVLKKVARKAGVVLGMAWLGPEEADEDSDEPEYVPHDRDERGFVNRQIAERPGQGRFRDALRKRYGTQCMVTGCEVLDVLEAAHIMPYRGEKDNDPTNGLLL